MNKERSFEKFCPVKGASDMCSTNTDEETKLSHYEDIRQEFQTAVDCIARCEFIIGALKSQLAAKDKELASKDEMIAGLEEKIVQMSLELATSKAFEDEHRAKMTVSGTSISSADGSHEISDPSSQAQKSSIVRTSSSPSFYDAGKNLAGRQATFNRSPPYAGTKMARRRSDRTSDRLDTLDEAMPSRVPSLGQLFRKPEQSDFPGNTNNESWNLDDSSSNRRLSNLGQLFRKNRNGDQRDCRLKVDFPKVVHDRSKDEVCNIECSQLNGPNLRKVTPVGQSSKSLIGSAVLFPSTFEDIENSLQACDSRDNQNDMTISINRGMKNLQKLECSKLGHSETAW
eukprot:CAMPEP_0183785018 /NCGR_PEP_ID=MMETSP0739-20130205/66288_1 /TAXON_ID=385413 /ORGANISM="Thalassiosira miniscula, Strain CCMP1093" /LENGTH=341 /DNA_ID=CAMNT_0026029011 /DNA_START=48 /DNA_END=1070 /DNA_ORIENTATION=-